MPQCIRLTEFKVEDFRSVVDSGWIAAERVTELIGVNESGKINLLLPLRKLNPAHEGELKPTSDYPKSKYAAVREYPGSFGSSMLTSTSPTWLTISST
jgi:hypothetical protein